MIQEELPLNPPFVEVVISGSTEDEVNCLIQKYKDEFDPASFGTEVTRIPTCHGGDLWEARVKRYATANYKAS